ncbi:MAG: SufD family Fe-S cluster assembly protein [Clostridia bacterium]|nr:SufD family Fe-S cluster assembly protein [Clostridia bacterium]MDD4387421.1 SufD family Fe-S cluster assembly protein [Clostridia bacterium]
MDKIETKLLKEITSTYKIKNGAYNIRKNGVGIERKVTENINIISKKDKQGIDIIIKENTKNEILHIPVIITEGGLTDEVYNDFFVGKNADVVIIAGCGIHNDGDTTSQHNGIHRFFLEENAKVKYIEKHIGEGNGQGKRILNPQTVVELKNGSTLEMETTQIKGVDSTIRDTRGVLQYNTNLIITEKIMTHGNQFAKTIFDVELNGENSSTKVVSRSIAKDSSKQEFISKITGNNRCFGHVECDAIIMDNASIKATPEITANNVDARLIHEATIGKIAGEQVTKLMTLGLTEKEAEKEIINGFLK